MYIFLFENFTRIVNSSILFMLLKVILARTYFDFSAYSSQKGGTKILISALN